MPRCASHALLCVALAIAGWANRAVAQPQHHGRKGDIAIVGGTVLPMDKEGVLPANTVLVRGDRIVAVAPPYLVDVGEARIIDATGKFVLPGLSDMHVHFWNKEDLNLFLLNGVTTVRNLFGSPEHVRWRDEIAKGLRDGPTILTAGPIIDGNPPLWPGSAVVTTPDAARKVVHEQKAAGYDWLKVYSGLSVEAYDAVLDEAKKVSMPVAGHVPKAVGIVKAIGSGQRTIEHLDGYVPFFGDPPAGDLVKPTVSSGVWNCPTLIVTDNFGKMDHPEQLAKMRGLDLVSPTVRDQWDPKNDFRLQKFTPEMFESVRQKNLKRRELVRDLSKAGGNLVLGTDTGNPYVIPGFAVVEELKLLVQSGLTPWQALRTATAAAGELQGHPGSLGVVVDGARADLIIVDKDPLVDINQVADPGLVIVRGVVHERDALLAVARKPPPTAASVLDAMPALPKEGTAPASATYDVYFSERLIGAERVIASKLDGGALVINGQGAYVAPTSSKMTYRSMHDELVITSDAITPPRIVITRQGEKAVATQDGTPPKETTAAADTVLAPQAIAEFIWYAAMTANLPVGKSQAVVAVEVVTDRLITLDPGVFTSTRSPDADGRRVYTIAGKNGKFDVTGTYSIDADGLPHEVNLKLVFGTFAWRRLDGKGS
jgi:imidazolonepropionase-like amidohydrolase